MKPEDSLIEVSYRLLKEIYFTNTNNLREELIEETRNMIIRYLDLANYTKWEERQGKNILKEYRGFEYETIVDMLNKNFNELLKITIYKLNEISLFMDFSLNYSELKYEKYIFPAIIDFIFFIVVEDLAKTVSEQSLIIKNIIFDN